MLPTATAAPPARARIALAHDWLVGLRGGELVLESIARVVREQHRLARIYTMFDDGRPLAPAIDAAPHTVSALGRLPLASTRLRRWLLPLYPAAVADLSRRVARDHAGEPIDLLISTSSAAIKALRAPAGVPHVCYCHAPARYLWSQTAEYSGAAARSLGLRLSGPRLREWDRRTASSVTHFIANSTHTARQIEAFYQRDAMVIHPPVRTSFFTPPSIPVPRSGWLYVGALEPYKRVDSAISAAELAGGDLTIVGGGSQFGALRRRASARVRFLGRISDDALREQYRRAAVLVFPQVEDFGIVAVEAQACGLPVAAFRAGGALDSVIDGRTGVFFDSPTPAALADAATRCAVLGDVAGACRENAERFDEARFAASIESVIANALATFPRNART